jgi:hypothetical protein
MNTYLVTVTYAGSYGEEYISAASPEQAVEIMREKLLPKFRRWANVFVG